MPVLALLAGALACASAQGLTLVDDGRPAAQIVLAADADDIERHATEELNAYLKKISGAELPVVDAAQQGIASVHIGSPDDETARALDLASLAFDGFVVDCDGERLILAGSRPRGTRNAVYWVLEELLGVRWFVPT